MDYERFLRFVKLEASLPADEAQRAIEGTLALVAARLPMDLALQLAATLPEELVPFMNGQIGPADPLVTQAVMGALRLAAGDDLWSAVAAELGPDPVATYFVNHIGSQPAAEAVLQTLAERVSGDAVADIVAHLPVELRAALVRGKPDRDAPTVRMTAEEFVARIAERAALSHDEAVAAARAGFAGLHEALAERPVYEVLSQLPIDSAVLLPRP